jgi:hypothetical protein
MISPYGVTTSQDILTEAQGCLKLLLNRLKTEVVPLNGWVPEDIVVDPKIQALVALIARCDAALALTLPAPGTVELPAERAAQIIYKFCKQESAGDSVKLIIDTLTDAHERGITRGRQEPKEQS